MLLNMPPIFALDALTQTYYRKNWISLLNVTKRVMLAAVASRADTPFNLQCEYVGNFFVGDTSSLDKLCYLMDFIIMTYPEFFNWLDNDGKLTIRKPNGRLVVFLMMSYLFPRVIKRFQRHVSWS